MNSNLHKEPQKKAAKTVVSTGDCALVVSQVHNYSPATYVPFQKGDIEADQSSAHDGSFFNYFNHNFSLLNNSSMKETSRKLIILDDKLAITQVMGEYLNSKNEWVSATIRAGSRSGYYSYSWNDLTRFNMVRKVNSISLKFQEWKRPKRFGNSNWNSSHWKTIQS